MKLWERIKDLARRVESNVPRHNNPEAFHSEKSELVSELKQISERIRRDHSRDT